jgi:hypothetical protein
MNCSNLVATSTVSFALASASLAPLNRPSKVLTAKSKANFRTEMTESVASLSIGIPPGVILHREARKKEKR